MKKFLLVSIIVCCICNLLNAQTKFPPVDKSPMDMSYYPNSYPVLKIQDKATEPLTARVTYSRPQKNGRSVFGELLPFGQVWRLGANEATEIEFYRPVKIGNTKIKKGRYTLYCIPYMDKWTLILNKDTDTWGSFKYDETKDIVRLDAPIQKQNDPLESFSIVFEKSGSGANLIVGWDTSVVSSPIVF